jgi:hypothetical protein
LLLDKLVKLYGTKDQNERLERKEEKFRDNAKDQGYRKKPKQVADAHRKGDGSEWG